MSRTRWANLIAETLRPVGAWVDKNISRMRDLQDDRVCHSAGLLGAVQLLQVRKRQTESKTNTQMAVQQRVKDGQDLNNDFDCTWVRVSQESGLVV